MSYQRLEPKLHIDLAWMNRISGSHGLFKKNRDGEWNCRCLICGDSKKDPRKARFWFLIKEHKLLTYCHNCGHSSTFYVYMKDQFPEYFEEYKKETLFGHFKDSAYKTEEPKVKDTDIMEIVNSRVYENIEYPTSVDPENPIDTFIYRTGLECIEDLSPSHPARAYLHGRRLDFNFKRLYYSSDFARVVEQLNPERAENIPENEQRIIIPFIKNGEFIGVQGRSLDPNNKIRYITVLKEGETDKIYNLDRVDIKKPIYIVEGPFDSMFLDNGAATCDAALTKIKKAIPEGDFVYVWDNQSRNRDVIRHMERAIDAGEKMVIWPSDGSLKEDINDLIINGMTKKELNKLLVDNTFSGLMLKTKFGQWKSI